jgi:hypothetical protein
MFAIYSLMDVPFVRFEIVPIPVREAEPVAQDGCSRTNGPRDTMGRFGLISTDERNPHEKLADLGLLRDRRGRDNLAFFGLSFLSSRRGKKRGD